MPKLGLFEREPRKARWTGSRALVPLDPYACPSCTLRLIVVEATQPALFRHGGFGEAMRGRVRWCPACRYVGGTEEASINPRRLNA